MASKNKIQIWNPDLHDSPLSALSQDVASGWTTLNIYSTSGFATITTASTYYYVLIGNYGTETSEIVLVSAKTDTTFTVGACKFSHSASDPVIYIPYNQIKFYGRITSGWSNVLLSTADIDCSQQSTSYEYSWSTYTYFISTYYRSATTAEESGESDEISLATFTPYSVKKIIEAWLRKAMTKADENPDWVLSWSVLIDLVNEWLGEILTRKKKWQCLHKVDSSITTLSWVAYISKPSDLSIMEFLYVNGKKIDYITKLRYNQYITSSITQPTGVPWNYTIKNDKIYLYPLPDGVYSTSFEYYSTPEIITTLTQEVKKEFVTILIYFIAAHSAYLRNNEKRGNLMEVKFQKVLENQVEDVEWYEQIWDAQSTELTSIYGSFWEEIY